MGLLDDAIREHLELKRRSGADPSEVARQEREALGPARRGPEPLEVPQQSAPAQEGADPALIDPQVDAPIHHEPDDVPEYVPPPEPSRPEAEPERLAEAPPVEPERSAAVPEEAEVDWEAPEAEAEAEAQPDPEPPPRSHTDQETVAFDAADIQDAERRPRREPLEEPPPPFDAGRDEDVLEETPDFLQETPEHDRLWFEQRPPRDFDFDG
ncbi:hypothetical protein [Capillimicrobium parvum]|uniref:Uncharacterized protein n=1 Tax=Capillimicrobium parvum TaxID=2884022 RepID=A0A9E6XUB5_9ACTN|nr:hypothetical protein [Capillimicrobium parvum]UGS33906.1 hypothetical protein DSM104329_00272 [Capillimicrobium parvum]